MDCSNCKAFYFGGSKRSSKLGSDEHKIFVKIYDCEKYETAKRCLEADHNFSWDQKTIVDKESRLIPRKIKGTRYFSNHINKNFYMVPELWLHNVP